MLEHKKNTILVPIDFSDIATNALNHAIEVARHFNNDIALLHVIEENLFSGLLSFGKNEDKEAASKEALDKLHAIAGEIENKHYLRVTAHVRIGRVYKVIAETATELWCDSIIMGSNGAAGFEQLIGSNASRVIIKSEVPVVVIKSDKTANAYKNIVFPLDLTLESRQKVTWAVHLGLSYQSTIRILTFHVDDESENARLNAAMKQIENILEDKGVKYTKHILNKLSDSFAEETIKYGEAIDADLILIMSHQEDLEFGEYIIGTEAQQIVNKSQKIPVMCIKPRHTGFSSEFAI